MVVQLIRLAVVFACFAPLALAQGGGAIPINNPEPVTVAALIAGSAVAGRIAYKRRRRGSEES